MKQHTQYENNQNCDTRSLSVVITGASSGIGRATALELAAEGHRVFLCARRSDILQEICDEIRANGGEADGFPCDVSQSEDVANFSRFIQSRTDQIDVLFNNAGCGKAVNVRDTTNEIWDQTLHANLSGTFYCTREFLPLLLKSPTAHIINNASIAAKVGFPGFTAYAAAKGGIVAFSNALREELRNSRVRVTVLVPGATSTGFWDQQAGEWDRNKMMTSESIARTVTHVITFPTVGSIDEIQIMPSGGAL